MMRWAPVHVSKINFSVHLLLIWRQGEKNHITRIHSHQDGVRWTREGHISLSQCWSGVRFRSRFWIHLRQKTFKNVWKNVLVQTDIKMWKQKTFLLVIPIFSNTKLLKMLLISHWFPQSVIFHYRKTGATDTPPAFGLDFPLRIFFKHHKKHN